MSKIQEELENTLKLLKIEWKEELEQYRAKTLGASITDKIKDGICWYPVQITKTRVGMGERLIIHLEKSPSTQSHSFQSGKSVALFSNASEGKQLRAGAVINSVKKNTMVLTLTGREWPDWLHDGKLGLDLQFDEASYKEMQWAMESVIKAHEGRLGQLKEILLGAVPAAISEDTKAIDVQPTLNESQEAAVALVAQAQDIAVIHGPPGTGKTTTLVEAIQHTCKRTHQVLVCAPSNAAVDLLVEKLASSGLNALRLGHPARVDDQILELTLDARISRHSSFKDLKRLRRSVDEFRKQGRKFKRNFGAAERAQRKELLAEATHAKEAAQQLEEYIIYDIFQQTQVIATTLVGAAHSSIKGMSFPVVFIDEAAQGLEPATWIPILKSHKVVMAGDHCQLPPTIKSYEAARAGLSETLFEKVIKRNPKNSQMLSLQYRMPQLIMEFPANRFYKGQLKASPSALLHQLQPEEPVMEYIDTAGSGFSEHLEKDSLSKLNTEEAKLCLKILSNLIDRLGLDQVKEQGYSIGIISPYKAQVRKINELIDEEEEFKSLRSLEDQTTIGSIDGFQGQERDIVVLSLVRSNETGEIGFLGDYRRMNVALTRAKRKLIVVGDSATLSTDTFYQEFLDFVTDKGLYKSVYEFMDF
ncbi:helicase [Echinicola pacifica]|uniref:DNA helicase n=1 Tax=Echinicola pacifica TaxID=346377 RepID=A0A918QBZ6_9BACT|nr:AAA domain-containing protein [Echinicola pacifica]GGZ39564.1 helicase [Echinicola pacifica]